VLAGGSNQSNVSSERANQDGINDDRLGDPAPILFARTHRSITPIAPQRGRGTCRTSEGLSVVFLQRVVDKKRVMLPKYALSSRNNR
jgi:hypothetical protein